MTERADRLRIAALCVASGALLCLSLPPFGFWPLAFVGLVGVDRLIADQPAGARFARGWLVAMACFVPGLSWMTALTLPGTAVACVAYSGMLGAGIAAAPPGRGRWLALPGTWALAELLRATWPFGGVPLANLAIGQVAGPLAPVLRVGGPLLLLVITVLAGMALAAAVAAVEGRIRRGGARPGTAVLQAAGERGSVTSDGGTTVEGGASITETSGSGAEAGDGAEGDPPSRGAGVAAGWALALGAVAVVVVAGSMVAPSGSDAGTAEIALVQGGGEQGTRKEDTGVVVPFERHVAATAGVEPPVDLVVWPEDVIDTEGAFVDHEWSQVVGGLAREVGAPMIVGTVEGAGPDRFTNAAVLVDASGDVVQRYDKVHRVPFGEYVPLRWLLEPIAGDALPDRDAVIGDRAGYLDVPGEVGRVAVPISWEIFFPDRIREGVEAGAGLVLNPTNGSSFTGTIVQTQQVASSRMRAIETGRWVAQVAPTGFTAVIDDEGNVLERSRISERRIVQREVTVREGQTLYTRWGNTVGLLLAGILIVAGWAVERRRGEHPGQPAPAVPAAATT